MRTDARARRSLFFFAHQDDEFGVFLTLQEAVRTGAVAECFYLTDGACRGVTSDERNAESLDVLADIGIPRGQVHFAGTALGIADGRLAERAAAVSRWIDERLDTCGPGDAIFVPAWEGGHQDHDALHALVVLAAARRGLLPQVWQFALYNKFRVPAPFFRVLNPLPANGVVHAAPIAWKDRIRHVRWCLRYRSQWRSWVGLLPFVVAHYLAGGRQALQPVSLERLAQRPHEGALLYEARGTYRWEQVAAVASPRG
jgi:LmbE family N-acetylglucosaminyl deacetylase